MHDACKKYRTFIWTYALMDNHVHHVAVPDGEHSLHKTWFGLARKLGEVCCPKSEVLVRSTDRMVLTRVKVGRLIGYFGN
jgi:hypothetical protein